MAIGPNLWLSSNYPGLAYKNCITYAGDIAALVVKSPFVTGMWFVDLAQGRILEEYTLPYVGPGLNEAGSNTNSLCINNNQVFLFEGNNQSTNISTLKFYRANQDGWALAAYPLNSPTLNALLPTGQRNIRIGICPRIGGNGVVIAIQWITTGPLTRSLYVLPFSENGIETLNFATPGVTGVGSANIAFVQQCGNNYLTLSDNASGSWWLSQFNGVSCANNFVTDITATYGTTISSTLSLEPFNDGTCLLVIRQGGAIRVVKLRNQVGSPGYSVDYDQVLFNSGTNTQDSVKVNPFNNDIMVTQYDFNLVNSRLTCFNYNTLAQTFQWVGPGSNDTTRRFQFGLGLNWGAYGVYREAFVSGTPNLFTQRIGDFLYTTGNKISVFSNGFVLPCVPCMPVMYDSELGWIGQYYR